MPFLAYENEGEINMFQIVEKRSLNPSMTLMVVKAPYIAKKAKAGQFIILRVNEKGERIPLTIADYDREVGTVTIIFQIVGKTTMMFTLQASLRFFQRHFVSISILHFFKISAANNRILTVTW